MLFCPFSFVTLYVLNGNKEDSESSSSTFFLSQKRWKKTTLSYGFY